MKAITNRARALAETLAVFFFVILTDAALLRDWIRSIYPVGDEFSLIVESQKSPWHWFLEGYSRYFFVYPEYTVPYSNFLRPVGNLIYWVFFHLGAGERGQLIIVNYGVHAACCAFIYLIARRLGNGAATSIAWSAVAFLIPAFWGSPMPLYPSFALDGLAALLVLGGLWLLPTRFSWLSFCLLLLSVFTKEAALPVVFAVAIYSAFVRKWPHLAASLSILGMWAGMRFAAFHGTTSGVYILSSSHDVISYIHLVGHNLSFLPIARLNSTQIQSLIHNAHISSALFFALILANSFIWVLLGLLLYRDRAFWTGALRTDKVLQNITAWYRLLLLGSLSVICSVLYLSLVGIEVRFAYVFYLCFLLLLLAFSIRSYMRNLILAILIATSSIVDIYALKNYNAGKDTAIYRYAASRLLIGKLRTIPDNSRPVFVFNDFVSGFSTEDNVAAYAGKQLQINRATSIDLDGCQVNELEQIYTYVTQLQYAEKSVTTQLPPCSHFEFEASHLAPFIEGNRIRRNSHIEYIAPEMPAREQSFAHPEMPLDLGSTLTAKVHDGAILYYDFRSKQWIYVP
jgi:hypothetical protein